MKNEIALTEKQIVEIREQADKIRKEFGIYGDVPVAKDIFMLLEEKEIILCQYPFQSEKESHMDANITWFETKYGPITFIGLNTSLYFDEQIFALAHELYHFVTKTGKAYDLEEDEDKLTERKADRFAAELLLPGEALHKKVVSQFGTSELTQVSELRLMRFIARLQDEWWLPYHSLVLRLYEEKYIRAEMFERLFAKDDRKEDGQYGRIFSNLAQDSYRILNERTKRTDISSRIMELFILNYEDGNMTDDDFVSLLQLYGKSPEDFGFDISVDEEDLIELEELFESGDTDES